MGESNLMEKTYTRREALKFAGKAAAGVVVAGVVPSILTGCAKKPESPSKEVLSYEYKEASKDAPEHPYPYQKLDVETAKERAYASFFNKGGCCRAVFDAIAGQLADNAGYPWNQIPVDVFANGSSGFGSGSLCGALGGAATVIGLACPPDDAKTLMAELTKWYTSTELPEYQPEIKNETVTATSADCKDSVGLFLQKTGYSMDDPERKARCAGLSADTAGKVVELINNFYKL